MTNTSLLSDHGFIDINSDCGHIGPFYWYNRLMPSVALFDSSDNVVQRYQWVVWGSSAVLFTWSDFRDWMCQPM
jgi:hypothetical protein